MHVVGLIATWIDAVVIMVDGQVRWCRVDHADYDDDDDGTGRLRPTKKAHGGYELRQHVCFGCFVLCESPIPEDPK